MPDKWIKVFITEYKHINLSTRNAITLLGYAYRLSKTGNGKTVLQSEPRIREYLSHAYRHIMPGDEEQKKEHDLNPEKVLESFTGDDDADQTISQRQETLH